MEELLVKIENAGSAAGADEKGGGGVKKRPNGLPINFWL